MRVVDEELLAAQIEPVKVLNRHARRVHQPGLAVVHERIEGRSALIAWADLWQIALGNVTSLHPPVTSFASVWAARTHDLGNACGRRLRAAHGIFGRGAARVARRRAEKTDRAPNWHQRRERVDVEVTPIRGDCWAVVALWQVGTEEKRLS